jgi:hypothetical protein
VCAVVNQERSLPVKLYCLFGHVSSRECVIAHDALYDCLPGSGNSCRREGATQERGESDIHVRVRHLREMDRVGYAAEVAFRGETEVCPKDLWSREGRE